MKLLIDADIMIYRESFIHEIAKEVEPRYWTWYVDENKVRDGIEISIAFLLSKLKADDYVLALSDDTNFRKTLWPDYKGQRSWIKRPLALKPIRKWFIEEHPTVIMPTLEGDDVLGILQTDPNKTDDTIIVSIDKDMKTIPGKYYRDDTLFTVTEEEANYNHLFQTLTGDIADGYKGVPGIGAVSATKILKEGTWEEVLRAFEKAKLTEEDALLNARMAKILHYKDYDHDQKQPILWSP